MPRKSAYEKSRERYQKLSHLQRETLAADIIFRQARRVKDFLSVDGDLPAERILNSALVLEAVNNEMAKLDEADPKKLSTGGEM